MRRCVECGEEFDPMEAEEEYEYELPTILYRDEYPLRDTCGSCAIMISKHYMKLGSEMLREYDID